MSTPTKPARRRALFITPQKPINAPINFDKNIFYLSKDGKETGLCQSTANVNKWKARKEVNATLDKSGTLAHQATVIHEIVSGDKQEIGVVLGVVVDPQGNLAVGKEITRNLTEMFDSDLVRKFTNKAMEWQHTVLEAISR